MSEAILNVAVGSWYPKGQARLIASARRLAPATTVMHWTGVYPQEAPTQEARPYAFKAFALQAARHAGFQRVAWMDASCWMIRPLDPLWKAAQQDGVVLVQCGFAMGTWATDLALLVLGIGRDTAMAIPLPIGGFFAVDFSHPQGKRFTDELVTLAKLDSVYRGDWKNDRQQCSQDPRVLGHRHDMVAMAYLAHRMGLPMVGPPKFFSLDRPNPPPETLVLARGM